MTEFNREEYERHFLTEIDRGLNSKHYQAERKRVIAEHAEQYGLTLEQAEDQLITDNPVEYVRRSEEDGSFESDYIMKFVDWGAMAEDLKHSFDEYECGSVRFWFDPTF